MQPLEIQLPVHTVGDTWGGIDPIGPILVNGVQPAVALASARLQFRKSLCHEAGITFATTPAAGEHPIEIVLAADWHLKIPAVAGEDFDLAAGDWYADLRLVDAAGATKTYYRLLMTAKGSYTHLS